MEPADLRAARATLGQLRGKPVTQHDLAKMLRMGAHGWQSVSRWEQDGNTVPGPVQVAIEAMLADRKRMERDNG